MTSALLDYHYLIVSVVPFPGKLIVVAISIWWIPASNSSFSFVPRSSIVANFIVDAIFSLMASPTETINDIQRHKVDK